MTAFRFTVDGASYVAVPCGSEAHLRSARYTASIERRVNLSDRLFGTRYWVRVERDGRYVHSTFAASLTSARRKIRRIVLNDIVSQSIDEIATSFDFKVD